MKFSIIRTNKQHQLCVTSKTVERFLLRIAQDDSKYTIDNFRQTVPYLEHGYNGYKDFPTWHRIYPAAEFAKEANGNLKMKTNNGLLLFSFQNLESPQAIEELKHKVSLLPSTFLALTGGDGKSVEVMVRYSDLSGALPTDEAEAERLYRIAYLEILPIYQAVVKNQLAAVQPSIRNHFIITVDPIPYYNEKAVAVRVDENMNIKEDAKAISLSEPSIESEAPHDSKATHDSKASKGTKDDIQKMINFLRSQYQFRYNSVMRYTEYLPKEKGWWGFRAVDPRVQKRMTLEVQLAGMNVSIKDVRNFLESDYIDNYDPIEEFLFQCYGKWDGKDHIRALARTVPTDNPHWEEWFYTWFLAMVDQWRHFGNRQYGNSVAPLLISKQGYNKSTFCRRLLPPELQWGYNDNLILSEKRQVLQAMSQFLVINLDEFNQISPKVQQGFLKNLIQLPSVKVKPPYASHVMDCPRMASFIATSNMTDILTDPSGNRRFIGIELTGPIDVSVRPNYIQLYAQALAAIVSHEKTYFDAVQTNQIMESNRRFQVVSPMEQCFNECFLPAKDEKEGSYMTVAAIFAELRARFGTSLEAKSLLSFGRYLSNMEGLKRKRTRKGTEYLVVKV